MSVILEILSHPISITFTSMSLKKTRWLLWDACRYHKLKQGLVLIAADS